MCVVVDRHLVIIRGWPPVEFGSLTTLYNRLLQTAPTLACNLYCLARYPEAQEKVYQEVTRVASWQPDHRRDDQPHDLPQGVCERSTQVKSTQSYSYETVLW